jgi:hypothetical protein
MQQGRVQLDADWNEQLALASHRTHMQTRDTIGCCGTPEGKSGFKIEVTPAGDDFFILPGTYYAGGLLCEIDPEWLSLHFRVVGFTKSAYVESAWFDGRPLRTGDWVEIKSKALGSSLRAQVTDVATDLTLQFSVLLSAYENMPDVRIRRIDTYLTQRFYPWPDSEPGFDSPPANPSTRRRRICCVPRSMAARSKRSGRPASSRSRAGRTRHRGTVADSLAGEIASGICDGG